MHDIPRWTAALSVRWLFQPGQGNDGRALLRPSANTFWAGLAWPRVCLGRREVCLLIPQALCAASLPWRTCRLYGVFLITDFDRWRSLNTAHLSPVSLQSTGAFSLQRQISETAMVSVWALAGIVVLMLATTAMLLTMQNW